MGSKVLFLLCWLLHFCEPLMMSPRLCGGGGEAAASRSSQRRLKYVFGDALVDSEDCLGPEGVLYPRKEITLMLADLESDMQNRLFNSGRRREGRMLFDNDDNADDQREVVKDTGRALLEAVKRSEEVPSFAESLELKQQQRRKRGADDFEGREINKGKNKSKKNTNHNEKPAMKTKPARAAVPAIPKQPSFSSEKNTVTTTTTTSKTAAVPALAAADKKPKPQNPEECNPDNHTPSRLCKTTYNTTAPMYGVSLTSGQPVTIVQKFPDLLQQVVYETCDTAECDLVHGECVQTYIPYLFLVIPLGPVTLTGQDYVLVESGCTCRPKYANRADPDPLSIIPNF